MERNKLASIIDHTCLRPDASAKDIERLCNEAMEYGFASVCVNPVWVSLARSILEDGDPFVCSVIGFPLGATETKGIEASRAIDDGAFELDMVIPIGHLKDGDTSKVSEHINGVVEVAGTRPVKVILETCYLTDPEKRLVCKLAIEAKASWVKTSTGFGRAGATTHDVRLLSDAVSGKLGVKASGGIRSREQALQLVEAGADRLGCSRSVDIVTGRE
ncbi:deoxyribose-phosphate aldolase [Candidatus Fermentibacteria bacterium]|nr:deoxyribose-phosphate aldolase [Candidatus Fermentibacteria bacterium]